MSSAPDNWPHSIDSTPVQKDTIWAKEIPLLCQIWWICQVMNMHYVRNTDVCCRRLIPCKSWWDTKFLWILRTFFNCKPVFWEWQWCLKCVQGQTLGELPLVEYHWDWLRFSKEAFNEDWMSLREVREVLYLCAVPGNSWEAVVTLFKPTPVLLRAWVPLGAVRRRAAWPVTQGKPLKWCTGAGCFCPVCGRVRFYCKVGTRSKSLLKLTCVKIQISGVVCSGDWPARKGQRSVTLGWIPLRYRWNRANTKAKILLAGFP